MHVAFFAQHYHTPDCPTAARPYALINRLAKDHDVTVITTQAWEDKRISSRFPWVPTGAKLVPFDVPYSNSMSVSRRLVAFLKYALRATWYGLTMSKPDLIIGSSTPLTAAAAAGTVAKIRGIPWIFEVRDLWPDFPIQMGAIPWESLQSLLYGLEGTLYRSATHVVTLSEDMETHVKNLRSPSEVTTVEYGSDFQLLNGDHRARIRNLRDKYDLDERFLIVYAGTFGRANDIPTLVETAVRLGNRTDLLFAFAGQGYHDTLIAKAAETSDDIRHLPPLPYPKALALFSMADVSLIPFVDRPVLAANSPGKLFDSLAAGTPIVVTNPGWTKRLVEEHACGWYVPAESPSALTACLQRVMESPDERGAAQKNAREVARERFDRSAKMDQYARLVSRVVTQASPSGMS